MRRALVAAALLVLALRVPAAAAAGAPEMTLEATWLTPKVLVLTEVSPWESNHVVVVTARGLVLVDPGHSGPAARAIRAAAARETGRDRVAWVVDHHEHWGHTYGNAAFPEARVVGQELVRAGMEAGVAVLPRIVELSTARRDELDRQLAGLDPASPDAAAARLQRDHFARVVAGLSEPGFVVRPPDLSFSDRMTLDLGDVTLRFLALGRGHSASDAVVVIPEERVALIGCFFYLQGQLPTFGVLPALDVDRWLAGFDAVLATSPPVEHVVLGQHAVWGRDRLEAMRGYVGELWAQVKAVEAEGVDLAAAQARLPVPGRLGFLRSAGVDDAALAAYHRGNVAALWRQLKTSVATELERAISAGGPAAGAARFHAITGPQATDYFLDENEVNLLGYRYLQAGQLDAAVAVFELNAEAFPGSWNVHDSLGEACAARGDTARAIALYRRSLELNPANDNGRAALERLGVAAADLPPRP